MSAPQIEADFGFGTLAVMRHRQPAITDAFTLTQRGASATASQSTYRSGDRPGTAMRRFVVGGAARAKSERIESVGIPLGREF
jgi:hypothetical protein